MKKATIERNLVVVLFLMVLVTFTMAQRDTDKVAHLYTSTPFKTGKLALVKKVLWQQKMPATQEKAR